VVDTVHLNPVRAGIVPSSQLVNCRWSSIRRFVRVPHPSLLVADYFLRDSNRCESPEGCRNYVQHLQMLPLNAAEQERFGFGEMDHGWAIGTPVGRKAFAKT